MVLTPSRKLRGLKQNPVGQPSPLSKWPSLLHEIAFYENGGECDTPISWMLSHGKHEFSVGEYLVSVSSYIDRGPGAFVLHEEVEILNNKGNNIAYIKKKNDSELEHFLLEDEGAKALEAISTYICFRYPEHKGKIPKDFR